MNIPEYIQQSLKVLSVDFQQNRKPFEVIDMENFGSATSKTSINRISEHPIEFSSIMAADCQKNLPDPDYLKTGFVKNGILDNSMPQAGYKLNADTAAEYILEQALKNNTEKKYPDSSDWPPANFQPSPSKNNETTVDKPQEANKLKSHLTALSLGDYFRTNFDLMDQNNDGLVNESELSKFNKSFEEGNSPEEVAFAQENYFALKSLSDDRNLGEKGISSKDIDQLYKNKRQPTSTLDFITSTINIAGKDPMHWGVSAALLINAFRTLHPATNLVLLAAYGLKIASAGNKFVKEQKRVDELYNNQ